jgi:hypothetical protein
MVKMDPDAVVKMLAGARKQRRYIRAMPSFTLAGVAYDYLAPDLEGDPEEIHSWEYGHWPKVEAAVPLAIGGTVSVYGEAMRWGHGLVLTRWKDDEGHMHSAWLPADNVRRLTASEWDIILPPVLSRAPADPVGQEAARIPPRVGSGGPLCPPDAERTTSVAVDPLKGPFTITVEGMLRQARERGVTSQHAYQVE